MGKMPIGRFKSLSNPEPAPLGLPLIQRSIGDYLLMLEMNCVKVATRSATCVSRPRFWSRSILIVVVSTFCWGIPGCGTGGKGPSGTVSGKVTLQEKPVAIGYVAFNSSSKGAAAGANLSPTGEFKLTDPLPVGEYVVTVSPPAAASPLMTPAGNQPPKSDIPEKYRSEAKTDLKFVVKAGANTANFDLKP